VKEETVQCVKGQPGMGSQRPKNQRGSWWWEEWYVQENYGTGQCGRKGSLQPAWGQEEPEHSRQRGMLGRQARIQWKAMVAVAITNVEQW